MKLIILSLLIITSIQNCQKKIFGESDNKENEKITQIVQDQLFKNGLSVRGHTSSQPQATGYLFPFGNNENTPVWSVAQWGSRNTLSNLSFTTQDDTIIYQNEAYSIVDKNTSYGLSLYDQIALDALTVVEQKIIY